MIDSLFQAARDRDDACRAFADRRSEPCPGCSYVTIALPAWAHIGATFAMRGIRYRIIGAGSTNRFSPKHLHFEDTVSCAPVELSWSLPDAPCPTADVKTALDTLFKLPAFRAHELVDAYLIEARA